MPSSLDLIDTVVVVILENRSFDHMLGYLNLPGPDRIELEGLRSDPDWLAAHQNSGIAPFETSIQEIDDPPHEQATIAIQLGKPATPGGPSPMNGFVASYLTKQPPPPDKTLVMGYYGPQWVKTFDFFARNYTVCDRWFASLPAGTQPNRLMAMSGSTSIVDNASGFLPDQELVYDWLTNHNVSWCVYQSGTFLPFFTLMPRWRNEILHSLYIDTFLSHAHPRFRRFSNFARDWTTEDGMPQVIFIEPEYTDEPLRSVPNDDHPPTWVTQGQAFLGEIYSALIANPHRWARTLLIVTYDEHGGFFDHVPPLNIPTAIPGRAPDPFFSTTGVRVPAFVISPLVEPKTVFRKPLEHTSILQFFADKFANGVYSAAVYDRQPALSRLSEVLTRSAPRTDAPEPPIVEAGQALTPVVAQRAPSASANAAAFRLAAATLVAEHPSLVWPELVRAAQETG